MEKFSLQHTVLYAKHWYKRFNPKSKRKTIWDDLMCVLEMDGYLGAFIGDSPEQIKNRAAYLIVGQFERLPKRGHNYSLQAFYECIKPHNCWKYGYYTKDHTWMRRKEDIDASPDYDYDEAVVRYCLSMFSNLSVDEWNVCKPDYTKMAKAQGITNKTIKERFGS